MASVFSVYFDLFVFVFFLFEILVVLLFFIIFCFMFILHACVHVYVFHVSIYFFILRVHFSPSIWLFFIRVFFLRYFLTSTLVSAYLHSIVLALLRLKDWRYWQYEWNKWMNILSILIQSWAFLCNIYLRHALSQWYTGSAVW